MLNSLRFRCLDQVGFHGSLHLKVLLRLTLMGNIQRYKQGWFGCHYPQQSWTGTCLPLGTDLASIFFWSGWSLGSGKGHFLCSRTQLFQFHLGRWLQIGNKNSQEQWRFSISIWSHSCFGQSYNRCQLHFFSPHSQTWQFCYSLPSKTCKICYGFYSVDGRCSSTSLIFLNEIQSLLSQPKKKSSNHPKKN